MLKTRKSKVLATLAAAAMLTLAAPVAANAEPSGQYVYNCVGTDGNSYTMASGARMDSCKGSYLQQYIGGQFIKAIALTTNGTPANISKPSVWCIIAIGGTAYSVLTIEDVVSLVPLGFSLAGLHECTT
jgi:hypothetical protein